MNASSTHSEILERPEQIHAWALLLAARSFLDSRSDQQVVAFQLDHANNVVVTGDRIMAGTDLSLSADGKWQYSESLPAAAQHMLDLYLPVLGTQQRRSLTVAHLGQSVDARIATVEGDAFFVTGEENRRHLHRLRALAHAVIVGIGTVQADDPQLTTRSVEGNSPVRVVIDPGAKTELASVLMNDQAAKTLLVHTQSAQSAALSTGPGYERVFLPSMGGDFGIQDIVQTLADRGLHRLFIEGGGVTVSRFLDANCLDRLHMATAPLLVGEGRSALQIQGVSSMQLARRPPYKLYRMGEDVLWDFDLSDVAESADTNSASLDGDMQSVSVERLL